MSPNKLSIIIPAFNASETIEECLAHIDQSNIQVFETILVNDASTDDTRSKAAAFPCTILDNETNRGVAAARNKGADEARGDIFLFLDADVLIPPHLTKQTLAFFEQHPNISILQGRYSGEPYYKDVLSQYKNFVFSFRGQNSGGQIVHFVHTACVAIRREVFERFRFDERLVRREDIEYGLRCSENGILIHADEKMVVKHKKKYNFTSFSRYQFQAAQNAVAQRLTTKVRTVGKELASPEHASYKKLWLLRPAMSAFLLCDLAWLLLGGGSLAGALLALILAGSYLLEHQFRAYLLRNAPFRVWMAAWWLYFYDGLLMLLGIAAGLFTALFLAQRAKKPVPSETVRV